MNTIILIVGVILFIAYVVYKNFISGVDNIISKQPLRQYTYSRKKQFITNPEKEFYKILEEVAGDKYYIFPQIHLSSLFKNETVGRYHKLAFQIINRRSVDYVLCDKTTLEPIYTVELDDSTHDTAKAIMRDKSVNRLFADSNLPLIRFKDYRSLSKEEIAKKFFDAHNSQKS